MNVCSEKLIYQDYFEDLYNKTHLDLFLWGEDLADKRLIPYAGKLKDLPAYDTFSDRLIDCGLIVINPSKTNPMRCITSRFDEFSGRIYITEDIFNSIWRPLRRSVLLGIRLAEQTKPDSSNDSVKKPETNADLYSSRRPVLRPEDIVVLDYLHRTKSLPVFENHRIIYKPKALTMEEKRLLSARQSALDNRKNLYFYSRAGGEVHDRDCYLLKNISNADFIGSEEHPEDLPDCPHCFRTLLLRIGCYPNAKEIPFCNRIFTTFGLRTGQLNRYVTTEGIRFHARSLAELTVTHGEDTWLIKIEDAHLHLWHNNYVKTSETERYLTSGFHDQGVEADKNLKKILNYIVGYTWQKHLEAEKMVEETDRAKDEEAAAVHIAVDADVRIDTDMDMDIATDTGMATSTEMNHTDPSPQETAHAGLSLWQRFTTYIKRLFHSID